MTVTERITSAILRWLNTKHANHVWRTTYRDDAPWGVS